MFCPKCGATNDDSSKFCLSCGGPLGEQPAASPPPVQPPVQNFYQPPPPAAPVKKSHTGLVVVIVLILVLVIGAAAVFFVMSNKNDKNDKDSTTKATTSSQSATTKASTTSGSQSTTQTTSYYSNPLFTGTWPDSPLLADVPKPAYGTIFTTDVSETEVVITYSGWTTEQLVDYIGIVKAAGFDKDVSQANIMGASTYEANNGTVRINVATVMGFYAITVDKM